MWQGSPGEPALWFNYGSGVCGSVPTTSSAKRRRSMRKPLVWSLLFVLISGIGVIGLTPIQTMWDDGLWPLSVTVVSASGSPIASISCEAFSTEESAQDSLENLLPPQSWMFSTIQNPFRNEPLEVIIPTSRKIHSVLFWSDSRYNQMRHLLVIAEYNDGRREGRLVEIPDLRQVRSLHVEIP
jgi:hypothetical protein